MKKVNKIGKAITGLGVFGFVMSAMAVDANPLDKVLVMTLISVVLIVIGIAVITASGEKVIFS